MVGDGTARKTMEGWSQGLGDVPANQGLRGATEAAS